MVPSIREGWAPTHLALPTGHPCQAVNRTFLFMEALPGEGQRRLLAMIGVYDHPTGKVHQPHVVHDKQTVDDPHDNPSLTLDPQGISGCLSVGEAGNDPGLSTVAENPTISPLLSR